MLYCQIITAQVLAMCGGLEKFQRDYSDLPLKNRCIFPDGSLQIEIDVLIFINRFGRQSFFLPRLIGMRAVIPVGFVDYKYLAPFEECYYRLFYCNKYNLPSGDDDFDIRPSTPFQESPDEYRLDSLAVCIVFYKKPTATIMNQLAQCLAEWQVTVQARGIADEGPILITSTEIECYGKTAVIYLDASHSGQTTLNWLIVSLNNFGMDVARLTGINFTLNKLWAKEVLQATKPPVRFPIPVIPSSSAQSYPPPSPSEPEEDGNYRANTEWSSDELQVRFRVDYENEWESLPIKIILDDALTEHMREELFEVLNAWLRIGLYGGFGGQGFKWFSEITYDADRHIVALHIDMGDVLEEDRIWPSLIAILAKLVGQGIPIAELRIA